jgi:hypothetical protein
MTDVNQTGNSEPETNTVDNITPSDFIDRRLKSVEETSEAAEVETQSTTEEASTEESKDVLSQMDLDNMSEEQLQEVSKKLGTKAVARFGELTARRKQAEERMAKLEQELASIKNDRENQVPEVKDNPLKKVSDAKVLKEHNDSAREVIEWAEALLDDHEDAKSNDVIAEVDGKQYTKVEIKKNLRQSRDMVNKFVPARAAELQKQMRVKQDTHAFQRKAITEFPWMKDKNNATTKRYHAMVNDKRLANLAETNPELSAQMPYLLAHAANSMFQRRPVSTDASKKPSITPPKSTPGTTATPERKDSSVSASQKEMAQRFNKTGSTNDYIALRTLQLKNR